MEAHIVLLQLVLIFFSARVVGELAALISIPSVIGEMAAGIIIGPSLLGWVDITDFLHVMAQIGVILLLFEVGIESNVAKLATAGGKALIVAVGGVAIPFGLVLFWPFIFLP